MSGYHKYHETSEIRKRGKLKLRCCSFRFIKDSTISRYSFTIHISVFFQGTWIKTCWNNAVLKTVHRDIEKACSWAANIYDTYTIAIQVFRASLAINCQSSQPLSESCVPRWEQQTCNWRMTTDFQRGDKHSVGNQKKKKRKRNKHPCSCSTWKICQLNKTINIFPNSSLTHDTIY